MYVISFNPQSNLVWMLLVFSVDRFLEKLENINEKLKNRVYRI